MSLFPLYYTIKEPPLTCSKLNKSKTSDQIPSRQSRPHSRYLSRINPIPFPILSYNPNHFFLFSSKTSVLVFQNPTLLLTLISVQLHLSFDTSSFTKVKSYNSQASSLLPKIIQ